MELMNIVINPLDPVIEQLLLNPEYITQDHVAKLRTVLPILKDISSKDRSLLKDQLDSQLRILEKLQKNAELSNDIEEQKKVLDASKNLFAVIMKFKQDVEIETKANTLEDAILGALDELGNAEIKARFLRILAKKLPQKTTEMA